MRCTPAELEYAAMYREIHRDQIRERNRARQIRIRRNETQEQWARRAIEGRVQYWLKVALAKGNMTRPERCEECDKQCKPDAAHYNYAEPLKVRWLCRRCHVIWDKAEPKMDIHADLSGLQKMALTADGRRRASLIHGTYAYKCSCGRVAHGNGGKTSHRKKCDGVYQGDYDA